jgi:hydroxymethylglutaryl-CoA lyase
MNLPARVRIREVGPRDGLQNESIVVPAQAKLEWINHLSETGVEYVEVTSFVSPSWIPALADAQEVARGFKKAPGVTYAALVPNLHGLERALESNVDEVAVFMSASETHNRKNINKSIQATFPVITSVANQALTAGKTVRGYISTVFGCPYEGIVDLDQVEQVIDGLLEMGVNEVSLGDTIGIANPRQVEAALERLLRKYPSDRLALHFHDTRGMALANILVALQLGMTTFDSSSGGLGGCPYAPGAAGNVATEDLVAMLHAMGVTTGIDLSKLLHSSSYIQAQLGKTLPSHHLQMMNGKE